MGYNNTVAIISNSEFTIQELKSMLVLLRDVDKVESIDYYDAEDTVKQTRPNVIILHATDNDKNCIKLLKKIRLNPKTKNIPVLLYADYCSTDYIVEAFDNGISDIISTPLKDYELVIRVIWAIQKNEMYSIKETEDKFLSELGIIDFKTGFYKEEFSLKFLESVITQAKTDRQKSCLILIKISPAIDVEIDKDALCDALKSSLRINDTIAMRDENTYYIFLSRAKLNGVYSIYERLLSKLGSMTAISASVVEIQDELFDDIINVLEFSINKAPKNGEIAVVQRQDFLDMYKTEEKEELEIAKILQNKALPGESPAKRAIKKEEANDEDKVSLGLKIMQEKVREIEKTGGLKKNNHISKNDTEKEIDERNAVLYKQAYAKKLSMIIEPMLEKYAGRLQSEYKLLDANISVNTDNTFMKLDKDDIKLNFEMNYDGLKTIKFNLAIIALGTEIESDSFEMEVMEFDSKKLAVILDTMIEEYKNYLSGD